MGVGVAVGDVVGVGVSDPIGCSNVPSSGTRSMHVARQFRPANVVTTDHRYTVRNAPTSSGPNGIRTDTSVSESWRTSRPMSRTSGPRLGSRQSEPERWRPLDRINA